MLRFEDQTAIVTGAGQGLGRAYALLLAERGAAVVVNDLSDAADAVVEEIRAAGGRAIANRDSVSTAEGGEAIVAAALKEFGSLHILVNNAGILRDRAFHNMAMQDVDDVIDVHLKGTFYVTAPAWRHLRQAGYGRIVLTASNSGIIGNFGQANYGAAKTGMIGLARVLAAEGRRSNIGVNVIAPAAATAMTEGLLPAEVVDALSPDAVAPVVAWLSHESCTQTGEVFSAGGGRVARFFTGLTRGYYAADLTPELVGENIHQVLEVDDFFIPREPVDELDELKRLMAAPEGQR